MCVCVGVGVERGVGVPLHGLKARRVGMACGQCFRGGGGVSRYIYHSDRLHFVKSLPERDAEYQKKVEKDRLFAIDEMKGIPIFILFISRERERERERK